jgi:hypothetical protein
MRIEQQTHSPALESVNHMIRKRGIEIGRNDGHAYQGTQTAMMISSPAAAWSTSREKMHLGGMDIDDPHGSLQ